MSEHTSDYDRPPDPRLDRPGASGVRTADRQLAALAGVVVFPLVVAASTLADLAGAGGLNPGSSGADLIATYNDFRERLWLAAALYGAAAAATLCFLGPLWARLRTASEAVAVVAVSGGVGVAVLLLGSAGWSLACAVAADFADAGAARFLLVAGWELDRLGIAPNLALIGAATVAGVVHQSFGRIFTSIGLLFTVVLVAGLLPVVPAGLMAAVATLWLVAAGITVAFTRAPAPPPDPAT